MILFYMSANELTFRMVIFFPRVIRLISKVHMLQGFAMCFAFLCKGTEEVMFSIPRVFKICG